MPKFRRKPLLIEAEQFLEGKPIPKGVMMEFVQETRGQGLVSKKFGVITIHGTFTKVVYGDWIVPEPDGIHYYPIKDDIFKNSYEPVEVFEPKVLKCSYHEDCIKADKESEMPVTHWWGCPDPTCSVCSEMRGDKV